MDVVGIHEADCKAFFHISNTVLTMRREAHVDSPSFLLLPRDKEIFRRINYTRDKRAREERSFPTFPTEKAHFKEFLRKL